MFRSLCAPAALALTLSSPCSAELSAEEFQTLHTSIQPDEEAWTTIPWQTSLLPAQKLAVEEGKPIFIWAMDGHPLGCT